MKYQGFSPNRGQTGSAFKPISKPLVPCGDCCGPRHYTALFSNAARAHGLNKTRDWVVLYYDGPSGERQCTVITSEFGQLQGKRIVRGREQECREHYRIWPPKNSQNLPGVPSAAQRGSASRACRCAGGEEASCSNHERKAGKKLLDEGKDNRADFRLCCQSPGTPLWHTTPDFHPGWLSSTLVRSGTRRATLPGQSVFNFGWASPRPQARTRRPMI